MFEFILDTTNLQVDYTLYCAILLGLTVKLFWIWNIEFKFVHSINTSSDSDVHLQVRSLLLQLERQMHSHSRLIWIVTYIRRKENPGDEPDHAIFSIPC